MRRRPVPQPGAVFFLRHGNLHHVVSRIRQMLRQARLDRRKSPPPQDDYFSYLFHSLNDDRGEAVEFARKAGITIHARATFAPGRETVVGATGDVAARAVVRPSPSRSAAANPPGVGKRRSRDAWGVAAAGPQRAAGDPNRCRGHHGCTHAQHVVPVQGSSFVLSSI